MGNVYSCDSCGVSVGGGGTVWHCEICENFDLCFNCKDKDVEKNGEKVHNHVHTHPMHEIAIPKTETAKPDPTTPGEFAQAALDLFDEGAAALKEGNWAAYGITQENIKSHLKTIKTMTTKPDGLEEVAKDERHEHNLNLVPRVYNGKYRCDGCSGLGEGWVYHCTPCQYDLHLECLGHPEKVEELKKEEGKKSDIAQFSQELAEIRAAMNTPVPKVHASVEAKLLFAAMNLNEEMAADVMEKLWKKYDTDGDGSLDFEETKVFLKDMEIAMNKVAKHSLGKEEGAKLFNFVSKIRGSSEEEAMRESFNEMDIDKSGRIEFNEFKKALQEHASKHDADQLVESLKGLKPELKEMESQLAQAQLVTAFAVGMQESLQGIESSGMDCKQQ